jgi:hypothetical protein
MGTAAAHLACAGERDLAEFMLYQLKPLLQDLRSAISPRGLRNEAPATIDKEAQPAADRCARTATEAITGKGARAQVRASSSTSCFCFFLLIRVMNFAPI